MKRCVIMGMNYPGLDALGTKNPGGAGHRLWQISGMSLEDYERKFQRRNLMTTRKWSQFKARLSAKHLPLARWKGRVVIVLGRGVWKALGLKRVEWLRFRTVREVTFILVPHPSGRNRFYNEKSNREMVGKLLRRL